jgi:predicted transcriptional regulator
VFFRDFVEDTAPGSRRKGRRRKKLTTDDKYHIAHKVLVGGELRKDVAKEMRVTPSVVSRLVCEFKDESLMSRLEWKEENYSMKVKMVKKIVNEMLEEDEMIDSAQTVSNRIEE